MRKCIAIVLSLMGVNFTPVFAADIKLVPARAIQKRLPDDAHIKIAGEIGHGDMARLRSALNQYRHLPTQLSQPLILLDSPGGSVSEALKMGRALRDAQAHTVVDGGSDCSSSCVFILAGGVRRNVFLNGRIGLHRPRFEYDHFGSLDKSQARQTYNSLAKECIDYMTEMGVSDRVFEYMLKTPSQEVLFIGREDAATLGLLGSDPAWEEWERAQSVNTKGLGAVEAMDRRLACYGSGVDKNECDKKYQSELRQNNKIQR